MDNEKTSSSKISTLIVAAAISGFVSGMPGAFLGSYVSLKLLETNFNNMSAEVKEIKNDQKDTQRSIIEISRQLSALQAIQAYQGTSQREYQERNRK